MVNIPEVAVVEDIADTPLDIVEDAEVSVVDPPLDVELIMELIIPPAMLLLLADVAVLVAEPAKLAQVAKVGRFVIPTLDSEFKRRPTN